MLWNAMNDNPRYTRPSTPVKAGDDTAVVVAKMMLPVPETFHGNKQLRGNFKIKYCTALKDSFRVTLKDP